jgi:hypothetical protein
MRRRQGVRPSVPLGSVRGHPLAAADRHLALLISSSQVNHVAPSTVKSNVSHAADYVRFCKVRGLRPWPVDAVKLSGWILILSQRLAHVSVRKYVSALPFVQANLPGPMPWTLVGDETIRRVMRYCRHRYPCDPVADKMPVSLALIHSLAKCLPGWPSLPALAFEDLLWLAASVTGTAAFLRGGEFLSSPKSDRAVLMVSDVCVRSVRGSPTLVVSPPQPKTRLDLTSVDIPVFTSPRAGPMAPMALWSELRSRRTSLSGALFAFVRAFLRAVLCCRSWYCQCNS